MLKTLTVLLLFVQFAAAQAGQVKVAVASNFLLTMKQLADVYQQQTRQQITISAASSGKLFTQISHGAPYDIFFSADARRADLIVKQGLGENSSVYAIGQLVYIAQGVDSSECRSSLNQTPEKKLAMANPKTAPYGLAAKQVLVKLGRWDALRSSIVMGENILQAYQFISSGGAGSGFIAASIAVNAKNLDDYCQWLLPANLYSPVRQKMVILNRAKNNQAVKDFVNFIHSNAAREIIYKNGYR